jgi:site-specific recombinase XerD
MKTKPEILARVVEVLRFKHYALNTEKTYVAHISSYIDWLKKHGRALPDSKARLESYLTSMAQRGCSASTQNQAFNALLFFVIPFQQAA